MKNRLRIYYEALEQAHFFLEPIVRRVFGEDSEVELIGISKVKSSSVIAESLANPLSIRNPDGIITWILNEEEIPLVWLEFSTQVLTLDHSLQSYNSFPAAGGARIPVVKFYAARESRSKHGGSQVFDARIPFQILFSKFNTPGVQLEWPTSKDKRFAIRNEKYRACPPADLGLIEILNVCKDGLENGERPSDCLIRHAHEGSTELAKRIASNLEPPTPYVPAARSTRFYSAKGRWVLKFNRWDHGMDPERGLVELYHHWVNEKLTARLHDKVAKDIPTAIKNFSQATGIKVNLKNPKKRMNITNDVISSKPNRAGLVIAWSCDEFTVGDAEGKDLVTLFWNISKPAELSREFKKAPLTKVVEKQEITEDEVTFILANRVFPSNKFTVQSVSYPGAQGDFALVLGAGRKATRKYFDVIAHKVDGSKYIVALTEAKGTETPGVLQSDVDVVLQWRDTNKLRSFLLSEMGLPTDSKVLGSIAYPSPAIVKVPNSEKLDFVVLINDNSWNVWAPYGKSIDGIFVGNGDCLLPTRFTY